MRIDRRRPSPAVAALALALVLWACGGNDGDGGTTGSSGPTTSLDLASRAQTYPVTGRNHVQGRVAYPQTPPVGGDHNPVWQNCGFYIQPVVAELAVHAMEHGAVWITFRPSLPKAGVDVLGQLARSTTYVLVSPWTNESLPAPVIASAWGVQLRADSATDPALPAFVKAYASGPQTPEKGAPCTGGFGSPE